MARRIIAVHACVAILLASFCVLSLKFWFSTAPAVVVTPKWGPAVSIAEPLPTNVANSLYKDIRAEVLGTDETLTPIIPVPIASSVPAISEDAKLLHTTSASDLAYKHSPTGVTKSPHEDVLGAADETITQTGSEPAAFIIPTTEIDPSLPHDEPVPDFRGDHATVGKITILYGEESPAYERALRTHEEHNQLHGYPMFVQRDPILDGYWTKPAYIQSILLQELSKPEDERLSWLFWVDADTVVLNYKMPLETFLPPEEDADLSDVDILVTEDWNGLNNGVFAVRVAPGSVNLLASVLAFRDFEPETTLPFEDQSAMEIILRQQNFAKISVTVPQRWFNSYLTVEEVSYIDVEVQRGDLLVHFAGLPKREALLDEWCDLSELHDPEWVVSPEDTVYPADVQLFWESFKVERAARREVEHMWETRISHLQLMVRGASRALMILAQGVEALNQSRSDAEDFLRHVKKLRGKEISQTDIRELNSTIGKIEKVLGKAAWPSLAKSFASNSSNL